MVSKPDEDPGWWWTKRGLAVAVSSVVAIGLVLTFCVIKIVTKSLTGSWSWRTTSVPVNPTDIIKIGLTVAGGVGVAVGLVVAYRRQRLSERDELRNRRAEQRDMERLWLEGFNAAADQLANERPQGRLVGVLRLGALADSSTPLERQQCINILCTYLRLKVPNATPISTDSESEQEIRRTIITTIRDRLRSDFGESWQGFTYDFRGARFQAASLTYANLSSGAMEFMDCTFSIGIFRFADVRFSGATVRFTGSLFKGDQLRFDNAEFTAGRVSFRNVTFETFAVFKNTRISGSAKVGFESAIFKSGDIDFAELKVSGGQISFQGAGISGSCLDFSRSKFLGGVADFRGIHQSSGKLLFSKASFQGGDVVFDKSIELTRPNWIEGLDFDCPPPGVRFTSL